MTSTTASRLGVRLLLLALLAPAVGHAQTTDPQLAQSLFDQARPLMAAQRFKEACPLFAESQRLDPGGGTLLNLAICHEGLGKYATAWTEFNAALSIAIKDGRKGRENIAREHLAALEPKLSHLTVTVPSSSDAEGLEVSLDGVTLARAAWGISAAVDPGAHKVEAVAPGRRGWSALIVMNGAGETRKVAVPPLGSDTSEVPSCPADFEWNGSTCIRPSAAAVPAPSPNPPPPYHPPPPPFDYGPIKVSSTSPFRYTVGALSLTALGTSLVTGILAFTDHNVVNDHCDVNRNYCDDQDAISKQTQSRALAWVSTISLGVGVLGAGAYLFWPNQTKMPKVTAAPVTGGAEILLRGDL
jgi:hypothetical protein